MLMVNGLLKRSLPRGGQMTDYDRDGLILEFGNFKFFASGKLAVAVALIFSAVLGVCARAIGIWQ